MTEDQTHKDNQIKLPRSLMRNNRYSDMLPCISLIFNIILVKHNVALIGESEELSNLETVNQEECYVNASYINVKI
jgi:hypothetical protein